MADIGVNDARFGVPLVLVRVMGTEATLRAMIVRFLKFSMRRIQR